MVRAELNAHGFYEPVKNKAKKKNSRILSSCAGKRSLVVNCVFYFNSAKLSSDCKVESNKFQSGFGLT